MSLPVTCDKKYPDPATLLSDEIFDREWALALMERGFTALEHELADAGKSGQFDRLKPWLAGDAGGAAYADVAREMGLSEGAIKVAIHRLRKRFGELVRQEIAQTISDSAQVQEELRYLVEVLSRG